MYEPNENEIINQTHYTMSQPTKNEILKDCAEIVKEILAILRGDNSN